MPVLREYQTQVLSYVECLVTTSLDPLLIGMELAEACASAGVPLVPIPGACAAVAAISVSGFPSSEFVFLGFLPRKGYSTFHLCPVEI